MAAKPKKPTYDEVVAENRFLRRGAWADAIGSALRVVGKWGMIAFVALQVRYSVEALAGTTTVASLFLQIVNDVNVSIGLSWLLSAGAVTYGLRQRQLRRRVIARQGRRLQELERGHDPKRTSSDLTESGDTPPLDRD